MEMELGGSTLATALSALVAVIAAAIAVTRARTGRDALKRCRGEFAEQQANAVRAHAAVAAKPKLIVLLRMSLLFLSLESSLHRRLY